jgi:putative ATPase
MCEAARIHSSRAAAGWFASEDVGNADPQALAFPLRPAMRATSSVIRVQAGAGTGVCICAGAEERRHLPARGRRHREQHGAANVPLHIRNAPTPLMKDPRKDYIYPPSDLNATPQEFLPDELKGWTFYQPSDAGFEAELAKRLDAFRKRKEK